MKLKDIKAHLRSLQNQNVKEYEDKLHLYNQDIKRNEKKVKFYNNETRNILISSGLDLKKLDELEKLKEKDLQSHLNKIRPKLIAQSNKKKLSRTANEKVLSIIPPSQRISLLGATLLSPIADSISGNPGLKGNPWIFPDNPSDINIKCPATGHGWGWEATGYSFPTAIFYYHFIPDQTGVWELSAITHFAGFYILKADDGLLTHKNAHIKVTIEMDVHQYSSWYGPKTYTLLNKGGSNENDYELYENTEWSIYTTPLRAGDNVMVKQTITVEATASGSGSYAEINFSDGNNVIHPLFLSAIFSHGL